MKGKKIGTKYPGVRYREHETRKHGPRKDRYYTIRYARREDSLGWASEGMSPAKAAAIRGQLIKNIKTGTGPQTLREMRDVARTEREQDTNGILEAQAQRLTISEVADMVYPVGSEQQTLVENGPTLPGESGKTRTRFENSVHGDPRPCRAPARRNASGPCAV